MTKYVSVTNPNYQRTKDDNNWPKEQPSLKCVLKEVDHDNGRRNTTHVPRAAPVRNLTRPAIVAMEANPSWILIRATR
jgi:hypothetical protein